MKVDLTGFAWATGQGVSLDQLFQRLKAIVGTAVAFQGATRLLYLGEKGSYHVGLFLTTRDQRKVCELQQAAKGGFKMTVRQLTAGTDIVDFNFFLVHKKTGRGIYQYYYHSAGLIQFSAFCGSYYDELSALGSSRNYRPQEANRPAAAKRRESGKNIKTVLIAPDWCDRNNWSSCCVSWRPSTRLNTLLILPMRPSRCLLLWRPPSG